MGNETKDGLRQAQPPEVAAKAKESAQPKASTDPLDIAKAEVAKAMESWTEASARHADAKVALSYARNTETDLLNKATAARARWHKACVRVNELLSANLPKEVVGSAVPGVRRQVN